MSWSNSMSILSLQLYSVITTSGVGPVQTDCEIAGGKSTSKFAASGDQLQLNYGTAGDEYVILIKSIE